MPSRKQATFEGNGIEHIQKMFLSPAFAFSAWNPFLAGSHKEHAQAREGFGTIASEWQGFVATRFQEHMALMQRLMGCRSPNEICNAYTDFWRIAAENYGEEFTALTKLMTGATSNMSSQASTSKASGERKPWQEAA